MTKKSMKKELKFRKVKSWENLIIIVTRECKKWKKIGKINILHGKKKYSIPVFQYKGYPLFGFKESKNEKLTKCPILVYEAIKQLLLEIKKNRNNIKNIYLLIHSEELGYNPARGCQIVLNNKPFKLSSRTKSQECHAVLESSGKSCGNWKEYLKKLRKETGISGKHWELWEFIHEENSPIYCCLKNIKNIYECLLKIGLKKDVEKGITNLFSLLKFRIAHLWLPLDIDLQGIKEVLSSESKVPDEEEQKRRGEEYLKKVIESNKYDTQFYRQKLANLQYVVAGQHVDFSIAAGDINSENEKIKKCQPVTPQDTKNLLADNKSIYDLILENKKDLIDSQDWQALKLLSGLKVKNGLDEKKTQKKMYEPVDYKNSPIFKFMCLLDRMKAGKYPIDVAKVIAPFDNWVIKGTSPEQISSFHDWFCALNNCLNNLLDNFRK